MSVNKSQQDNLKVNIDEAEINKTQTALYHAIQQTMSMVNIMIDADCFQTTLDDDFCDIRNILDVCKDRLESAHELFEACEINTKRLCELKSESSSNQKLSQLLEVDFPSIDFIADFLSLVTRPSTNKAWHKGLIQLGNRLINASHKAPKDMFMVEYLIELSHSQGGNIRLITNEDNTNQLILTGCSPL